MTPLLITAGTVFGLLLGYIVGNWFGRKSVGEIDIEGISAKLFAQQSEHILQLAESKLSGKKDVIDTTLRAMKGDLTRVENLMQEIGKGNVQVGTRLGDAAKVIKELSETAGGLRNALSSNSMRGQWGERMAEDVLRLSGLIEGINYVKQAVLEGGAKPDFTFMLPQQRTLNMDVKFPFNNYQLYADAKTEKDKKEYQEKFLKDVRKRLKEVQTREYINPQDGTVDYVLMFVPNEQIFSFINETDRELIDEAMRGKTILCSPLSLYAILAVIRHSIDNFSMESKSREMLNVFAGFKLQWEKFKEQMETVKQRFESVHKGYEELTGARERQLDKQLDSIEKIRADRSLNAPLEEAVDQAKQRALKKATVTA